MKKSFPRYQLAVLAVALMAQLFAGAIAFAQELNGPAALQASGAASPPQWIARYNGPANNSDWANALALDSDGNVCVTGESRGLNGAGDYLTVNYNADGVRQWSARFNASGNDRDIARDVAIDVSGNVYVTGNSSGNPGAIDGYLTIKYDSAGVRKWTASYSGPDSAKDEARALAVDGAGNVYVTGYSTGIGTRLDFATIKYNNAGKQKWVKRYNAPANSDDDAIKIAVDGAGNVHVAGTSIGANGNPDYFIIKYNNAGEQQWVARYNGPTNGYDTATNMTLDSEGNVYITGVSGSAYGGDDYVTIKYNSTGVRLWVARFNSPAKNSDVARALAVDASGNVYVSGGSENDSGSFDAFTIKYDSAGVRQWTARYNGTAGGLDGINALALDGAGNVYVTGFSEGVGAGFDYLTIKYNSAGVQQWVARFNPPANGSDEASDIAVDALGNVWVTGTSTTANGFWDYLTIKYSASGAAVSNVLATEVENETLNEIETTEDLAVERADTAPIAFALLQNYPNPFNPTTTIRFSLATASVIKLTVYNVKGELVQKLMEGNWPAGDHERTFDAGDLASGVYLCRLEAGTFTATQKMILAK